MVMCAYHIAINLLQTFKGALIIPPVSVSFLNVGGAKLIRWNKLSIQQIVVNL